MASSETSLTKLQKAVENSWGTLRPFRRNRDTILREYAGHLYGKNAGRMKPVYLNRLKQTGTAYLMALSANNPKVLVTTDNQGLKAFAFRFQQSLNRLITRIDLKRTIDGVIMDAFFGIGIAKVCLADGFEVEIGGTTYDIGLPSAKRVSLENWVHDTGAQEWNDIQFCGHRYRAPLAAVKEDDRFDRKITRELTGDSKYPQRRDGEVSSVMHEGIDCDELEEHVDLWEIFLPRTNRIITVTAEGEGIGTKKLSDIEWIGPEKGPYRFLGFDDLPDNTMPIPPAYNLYELHMLENNLMRKQAAQAKRQKDVGIYPGGAEDTVNRINKTADGEWLKSDRAKDINFMKMGGVDAGNFNFLQSVHQHYNEQSGNLQAMLGLGPMSDTAGQDRMINENVSETIAKMQARVTRFTTEVCRDLGLLSWDHNGLVLPGTEDLGSGITIDTSWTPAHRQGQFIDHQITIEPYSQAYQSPGERAKKVMNYVMSVVLPSMPMRMEQGAQVKWQKIDKMISEYDNIPELMDITEWSEPIQQEGVGPSHQQMKPAMTQRTVVRQNGGPRQAPIQMPMQQQPMGAEMGAM